MLPILMFNNMEGGSNSFSDNSNQNFSHVVCDDGVILNYVRSRKKVSESVNCPICSCTIRPSELEAHLALEVEKLQKLSSSGTKRKLSANGSNPSGSLVTPSSSSSLEATEEQDIDVTGCPGADVYQRVHANRLRRLRTRRRSTPPPQQGECPVCNVTFPTSKLQRHALRCLKRTGAHIDEDIPDSSSEDGSIDVENDEPAGSSFGAVYEWCGQERIRATALQPAEARGGTCIRRVSNDQALVVDGDEDTELYGPAQYSPSRIAPPEIESNESNQFEADGRVESEGRENMEVGAEVGFNGLAQASAEIEWNENNHLEADYRVESEEMENMEVGAEVSFNGLVQASAETRIQALKVRIKELEKKQNSSEAKCLICLCSYTSPAVSIQCWHVYCEECWLESLRAKKICPQCNAITTAGHLRRIYM